MYPVQETRYQAIMSSPPDRRTRKRLATRQSISDAATRLFWEKGFDAVTVDEIAAAADVGRMTVFNHFPRKEDLFFDRDAEGRERLRETLRARDAEISPIESLRRLAHRLVAEGAPYIRFSPESRSFIRTIEHSETLKARARAIRDELAASVALAMAESVGRRPDDPEAIFAAGLQLATWSVAFIEAHRLFAVTEDAGRAESLFLALVDRGAAGIQAAMTGTPYARQTPTGRDR